MRWLMALMMVAAVTFGGPAVAHDTDPLHYHVGETQVFKGLVCRSQESAMHIFNTWMEVGVDSAQEIYKVYQTVGECGFLTGYRAFFVERIISSIAPYFNGGLKNVLVFSIVAEEGSESVDFLVTWENLATQA